MKNQYFQKIRGICVLLVLLCHTIFITDIKYFNYANVCCRRLINFAVPVFIFMSAYFLKYDNYKSFITKKIKRVIVPLIIWKAIYGTYYLLNTTMSIKNVIKSYITGGYHLYYLVVLFCLYLITPLLIKYIKRANNYRLLVSMLISFIFNLLVTVYNIKTGKSIPLYNYIFLCWITYYYLGLLFNYKKGFIEKFNKKAAVLIIYIIALVLTLIEGILIYKLYGLYSLALSQVTITNVLYSSIICIMIVNYESQSNKSLLAVVGDYSYGIYLSHILFLEIINKLYLSIPLNYYLKVLSIYVTLVIVTFTVNLVYYKTKKQIGDEKNAKHC